MPPRRAPENRFGDLLEAATRVFIAQGYRLTQMSDVAQAMGVAKGTVYLYVKSKEALFAAALLYSDRTPPPVSELSLPIAAPKPGELLRRLREELDRAAIPAALARALARVHVDDVRAELEEIVRELYATSSAHRTAIKLVDRCGRDHPELRTLFYAKGRFAQVDQLARYFDARIRTGQLRAVSDSAAAARFVIEAIATWAVHIHWDPAPQGIEPKTAEETVVQFLIGGLLELT
jgi:AcrR family transcriptional regulator